MCAKKKKPVQGYNNILSDMREFKNEFGYIPTLSFGKRFLINMTWFTILQSIIKTWIEKSCIFKLEEQIGGYPLNVH